MTLVVEHPANRTAERRYIYGLLLGEFLGLEHELREGSGGAVRISWKDGNDPRSIEMPDILFSTRSNQWLRPASMPVTPTEVWDPPREHFPRDIIPNAVPLLYSSASGRPVFERMGDNVHLRFDLFGASFFLLSRYEEIVNTERDEWDRFRASSSFAYKQGFLRRPVVNEYTEILWQALALLWPGLSRKKRSYRALISHDVDVVSVLGSSLPHVAKSLAADLLKRHEPFLALRRAQAFFETLKSGAPVKGEPYDTFSFLMDTSERSGLRSSFNFVAGISDTTRDPTYDVGSRWMRALLSEIHKRGHELGLHPSFCTFRDKRRTREEFERLKSICRAEGIAQAAWGGRQHYLRWQNPTTSRIWEDVGLDYDSSVGFADEVGFRSSCCYEYPIWDLSQEVSLKLRERPLIAMEGTLLLYMKYSYEAAATAIRDLAKTCRKYEGDFTLLWHNHMLASKEAKVTYTRIVESIA